MKRTILIVISLILVFGSLVSCATVSVEDYANVQDELRETKLEVQSLQSQLAEMETELDNAKQQVQEGRSRIAIINALFVPVLKGEIPESAEMVYFLNCRDRIYAIGDSTLTEKFDTMIDHSNVQATEDFFVYLFESTADVLD